MGKSQQLLITKENGKFLEDLSLKQSENFLMNMFGTARNEVGLIYDDVNKPPIRVLFSEGEGHSVDLDDDLFKSLEEDGYDLSNLTFTHNHPEANPLSESDVMAAINHDMKQIRAVGKYGKFALTRPELGWGDDEFAIKKAQELANVELSRSTITPDFIQTESTNDGHGMIGELHQYVSLEKMNDVNGARFTYETNPNNISEKSRKPINRRNLLMTRFNKEYGTERGKTTQKIKMHSGKGSISL